jgi:DNA-directed RNA polymerase subunit omega
MRKIPEKKSLSYATRFGRIEFFRLTEKPKVPVRRITMKQSLVQDALKVVHSPQILVNIVSKRVRQLGQGFRPLIAYDPKLTFMDVALKEVADGKLSFELLEVVSAASPAPSPKKGRKSAA